MAQLADDIVIILYPSHMAIPFMVVKGKYHARNDM